MRDQYVAADVHQATTTFVVRDAQGRVTSQATVRTQEQALVAFVRGLGGGVHLTFEESPYAEWLYELWVGEVQELVVCNPRQHVRQREDKADRIDAEELSERLRGGFLRSVYHGEHGTAGLRELVGAYRALVGDSVRVRNRLRAVFRGRGLGGRGSVQELEERARELPAPALRQRVEWLWRELERIEELRREARQALEREAHRHRACELLRTVPGIGRVRAAILVAQIRSPYRFRTKRQLWKYSGLAVVTHSSSDYRVVGGEIQRRRRQATRGLNRHANRWLKETFKSAAVDASRRGALRPCFERLVSRGVRPEMATLTVARKIAATCLAVWKKGEPFDPEKVLSAAA